MELNEVRVEEQNARLLDAMTHDLVTMKLLIEAVKYLAVTEKKEDRASFRDEVLGEVAYRTARLREKLNGGAA